MLLDGERAAVYARPMNPAKRSWTVLAALFFFTACGGKVVVEEGPGGGAGGAGGAGSSAESTGASPLCGTVDPVGTVEGCTFNSGDPEACSTTAVCDVQGHSWEQTCKETSCVCSFNGVTTCICVLDGPGDFCAGTAKCCPAPWQ